MLTMWATLKVLGKINGVIYPAGVKPDFTQAFLGNAGGPSQIAGETFLSYAIVIAMIIGALIVAEKFGAYGAGERLRYSIK